MRVISGLDKLESAEFKNVAATIGTFDGVHLGHKKIIEKLLEVSGQNNLLSTLITFQPHPQMLLGKRGPIELLTTIDERLKLLEKTGIEAVVILGFNRQLASYPPEDFVREILLKTLDMKALVFGFDHVFGKDRAGNKELLESLAKSENFKFAVVPQHKVDGIQLKSTPIRHELKSGDYKKAITALGYNYFISGRIIKGHGIGKTLGYPTVNLAVFPGKLLPKDGVYSAVAHFDDKSYDGMAYIGQRLTFDDETLSVEINLFDFTGNIESGEGILELVEFIRAPEKFDSADELTKKIMEDEKVIRNKLS